MGIGLTNSPGAYVKGIYVENSRGPDPKAHNLQASLSDNVILEDFHMYNDNRISWAGDVVSFWRSSNIVVKNGLVDGCNDPVG